MAPQKVLLIYPGSKSMGMSFALGLMYIAKTLQNMRIDVKVFHFGMQSLNELPLDDYLFAGISMLTGDFITNGLIIARKIKNFNNSIPIVLGGVHPSLLPEQSLRNELVDIVVIGEGEETVKELAAALISGSPLSGIKGLAYKDKEKNIFVNPPRERSFSRYLLICSRYSRNKTHSKAGLCPAFI